MTLLYQPDKAVLVRYFKGNSTKEETELIELYLASELDAAYVEECLKEAQEGFEANPALQLSQVTLDDAWQEFQSRIHPDEIIISKSFNWKYAVAAAVAVICIGLLTFFFIQQAQQSTQHALAETISYEVLQAPAGRFKKITLPDGSRVTLFPGTQVRYPHTYNRKDRSLMLSGKAYFEVVPDPEKPFFVSSGQVTTRVLGTSFEIDAPTTVDRQKITLRTGKVSIYYGSLQVGLLTPDEQMTISSATDFTIRDLNATEHISWILGQLTYEQAALADICAELENWYNVKIRISDPALKSRKMTASFKKQSLDTVMDILSRTGSFKYKIDNKQVVIY